MRSAAPEPICARTGYSQQPSGAKAAAFYRILRGHQDRRRIAEGKIGGDEAMMVGKGVGDHVQPCVRELLEEALRAADPGHRMQRRTRIAASGSRRAGCRARSAPRRQPHAEHRHRADGRASSASSSPWASTRSTSAGARAARAADRQAAAGGCPAWPRPPRRSPGRGKAVVLQASSATSTSHSGCRRSSSRRGGRAVVPTTSGQPVMCASSTRLIAIAARVAVRRHEGEPACALAVPPWPRLTMPGRWPAARNTPASQSTTGVLPLPPTAMLPTTITATGRRCGRARATAAGEDAEQQRERTQGVREGAAALPECWGLRGHASVPGRRGPGGPTAPTTGLRR